MLFLSVKIYEECNGAWNAALKIIDRHFEHSDVDMTFGIPLINKKMKASPDDRFV